MAQLSIINVSVRGWRRPLIRASAAFNDRSPNSSVYCTRPSFRMRPPAEPQGPLQSSHRSKGCTRYAIGSENALDGTDALNPGGAGRDAGVAGAAGEDL